MPTAEETLDLKEAFSSEDLPLGKILELRRSVHCSIERRADRWFVNFTPDEIEQLLAELHGEADAALTSETLMVR